MQSNDGSAGALIFALLIIALYVAAIVWIIKLKGKMVQRGADIPTSFLLFVPLANIYWMYKWFMGVEQVTNNQVSGILMFALNFFIGPFPLLYAGYKAQEVLKNPPQTNYSPVSPGNINQQGQPQQQPNQFASAQNQQPQQTAPQQAPQPTQQPQQVQPGNPVQAPQVQQPQQQVQPQQPQQNQTPQDNTNIPPANQ